ncbi:hypothetical protein VZT92_021703 [Zoarces viviparus]|uniref:Uncharacterized protein n=1 Tax=Zoarces viviparus TaxID=48416 RepID=A0AAW1E8S7_ZOAVI
MNVQDELPAPLEDLYMRTLCRCRSLSGSSLSQTRHLGLGEQLQADVKLPEEPLVSERPTGRAQPEI